MEKPIKKIVKREFIEWTASCSKCQKQIIGSTEMQVIYNLTIHQQSKGCKK